jgi:hypothetical protein
MPRIEFLKFCQNHWSLVCMNIRTVVLKRQYHEILETIFSMKSLMSLVIIFLPLFLKKCVIQFWKDFS